MEHDEKRKDKRTVIIPIRRANEKVEKKSSDMSAEDISLQEMEDRWRRALADFDNYRKRCEREMQGTREDERARVLASMLPVLDSIENALKASKDYDHPIVKGVESIYKLMKQILSSYGVEEIEAEKMLFDPNWHEVVGTVANPQLPDGFVWEVVQKGYKLGDRMLRPAKVIVVKNYENNNQNKQG
ncbi:MAG TPA: nucleotide exchange factor GrpE [Deltaproteobacteria bacterium]|nr:nucleotide exchange factor GrpE [Deltaproteobacteria bacterium]